MICSDEKEIMVTVKMLAYNHEPYIATAIESIVSQKTEHRFELLIGEDCSSDGTRKVIEYYAAMYPDIIVPIFHKRNLGCTRNSYLLDRRARGRYIAACEGDDYWCDKTRIQRDVDFLEAHPDYAGICHRCRLVDEDGNSVEEDQISDRMAFWRFDKEHYSLKDYERWRMPGHTSAMTSRNYGLKDKKKDFSIVYKASTRVGDRTHLLLQVLEGEIYCAQDVVVCYRFRTDGQDNNYVAIQKKENLKDEEFRMMCRLEDWAWESRGIKLDLEEPKKDRFVGSVVIFMRTPSRRNLRIIVNIMKASGEPLRYLMYMMRIVLWKVYYWTVKQEDRMVKL